jgi:hypothetical protein
MSSTWLRLTAAALLFTGASLAIPAPANAQGVGYVRLAHLSPDTPAVDVYLSSLSGGFEPKVFPAVGYGVVSSYLTVPTGVYAAAMRSQGAAPSSPPVLNGQVTVVAGKAYTVAGVGRYADLGLRVFQDNLALPKAGQSKVRVIQASIRSSTLDLNVAGGAIVAKNVTFATTTDYTEVRAGSVTLEVKPSGSARSTDLQVKLAAGGVYSVIVLDGPTALTAELRTDALGGTAPRGGVDTGSGGSATNSDGSATGLGGPATGFDASATDEDGSATADRHAATLAVSSATTPATWQIAALTLAVAAIALPTTIFLLRRRRTQRP